GVRRDKRRRSRPRERPTIRRRRGGNKNSTTQTCTTHDSPATCSNSPRGSSAKKCSQHRRLPLHPGRQPVPRRRGMRRNNPHILTEYHEALPNEEVAFLAVHVQRLAPP